MSVHHAPPNLVHFNRFSTGCTIQIPKLYACGGHLMHQIFNLLLHFFQFRMCEWWFLVDLSIWVIIFSFPVPSPIVLTVPRSMAIGGPAFVFLSSCTWMWISFAGFPLRSVFFVGFVWNQRAMGHTFFHLLSVRRCVGPTLVAQSGLPSFDAL